MDSEYFAGLYLGFNMLNTKTLSITCVRGMGRHDIWNRDTWAYIKQQKPRGHSEWKIDLLGTSRCHCHRAVWDTL